VQSNTNALQGQCQRAFDHAKQAQPIVFKRRKFKVDHKHPEPYDRPDGWNSDGLPEADRLSVGQSVRTQAERKTFGGSRMLRRNMSNRLKRLADAMRTMRGALARQCRSS